MDRGVRSSGEVGSLGGDGVEEILYVSTDVTGRVDKEVGDDR